MGAEIMDTPETDAVLAKVWDDPFYHHFGLEALCRSLERERNLVTAIAFQNASRLERERDLALAIARKYYNGPELTNFPNVKV